MHRRPTNSIAIEKEVSIKIHEVDPYQPLVSFVTEIGKFIWLMCSSTCFFIPSMNCFFILPFQVMAPCIKEPLSIPTRLSNSILIIGIYILNVFHIDVIGNQDYKLGILELFYCLVRPCYGRINTLIRLCSILDTSEDTSNSSLMLWVEHDSSNPDGVSRVSSICFLQGISSKIPDNVSQDQIPPKGLHIICYNVNLLTVC